MGFPWDPLLGTRICIHVAVIRFLPASLPATTVYRVTGKDGKSFAPCNRKRFPVTYTLETIVCVVNVDKYFIMHQCKT